MLVLVQRFDLFWTNPKAVIMLLVERIQLKNMRWRHTHPIYYYCWQSRLWNTYKSSNRHSYAYTYMKDTDNADCLIQMCRTHAYGSNNSCWWRRSIQPYSPLHSFVNEYTNIYIARYHYDDDDEHCHDVDISISIYTMESIQVMRSLLYCAYALRYARAELDCACVPMASV